MIPAKQIFMSLWLFKVLTLIFLRNSLQSGFSQHLTGPSPSLHSPHSPQGAAKGWRRPWFHFLEVQGIRQKEKESRTAQDQGAGNSQASPFLGLYPNTLPSLSLLMGKPTEQLSVPSWAPWRPAERLGFWLHTPNSPLIGCVPRTVFQSLFYSQRKQISR